MRLLPLGPITMRAWSIKATRARKAKSVLLGVMKRGADKIHSRPAHVGESPQFGAMRKGSDAQRVPADKAYASKTNRAALKGKHRDGILHKAVRG